MKIRWEPALTGAVTALLSMPLVLALAHWISGDEDERFFGMLHTARSHERCIFAASHPDGSFPASEVAFELGCGHRDAWDRPFRYERSPADPRVARFFTLGADDREGGAGRARDIVYWLRVDGGPVLWLDATSRSRAEPPEGFAW